MQMRSANTRVRVKGTRVYLPQHSKREAAFDGGSTGRRVQNWTAQGGSINSISVGSLRTQRNRARDLVRKVPWIASAVESYSANLIGSGIKPNSQAENPDLKKAVNSLFLRWVDDADADGLTDFYGLLEMAVRARPSDGEIFYRFRIRRMSDGLSVPFQLQALEAEYVPVDKNELLPNGNKIIMGVEFNKLGKRVAYHMYREHPEDIINRSTNWNTVRVPADQVIHFFIPERPGQVRGLPSLGPVTMRVRDLLEYEDAELVRKKTAAMFTAFIEQNDLEDDVTNEGFDGEYDEEEGVGLTSLEPGTVQLLEKGESVKFSTPADVGGNYEAFLKMQLRAIAAGIGVTYEQMTGDLENVNFSSIRAGLLEFQRRAKQKQRALTFQICKKVWKVFFDTAVLSGALNIRGYAFNPEPHRRVLWVPPGWRYVNPAVEVAAAKSMIRAGLTTRSKQVAELGEDIDDIDRELAADNDRADKYGLVLDSDARKTTNAGLVADRKDEDEA